MKFRFIDTGYQKPAMNMAIDEALLASKLPVLRFYGWKPAGLSIGYFQSVKNLNFDSLKRYNVDLVRRLTGGNAVLHDKELTYSFIIDENMMPKTVIESYKDISKGLLLGLNKLGLNARMNEFAEKGYKSPVCFYDPSWYEVLVNGKKIIGSAQKRIDGKILQHGAILIDVDVEKYCSLFKNGDKLIQNVKGRMTSINEELGSEVDYKKVKEAVKNGFLEGLDIEFETDELTVEEKKTALDLDKEKYSTDGWNKRF